MNTQRTDDLKGREAILYSAIMVGIYHYISFKTHRLFNTKSKF